MTPRWAAVAWGHSGHPTDPLSPLPPLEKDAGVATGHASPAPHGQPDAAPPALGPAGTPGVSSARGWAPWGDTPPQRGHPHCVPLSPQGPGCHHGVTGPVGGQPRATAGPQPRPAAGPTGTAHGGEHPPTHPPCSTLGCRRTRSGVPPIHSQCTVTLRCSYVPRGTAGDAAVPLQGPVPPPPVSPVTAHRPGEPPAGRKEDFQVWHPWVRWDPGVTSHPAATTSPPVP